MAFSDRNRNLKVSVYAMLGLALFVGLFIFYVVGSNQRVFSSKYSIYMFMPNVEGLLPGAFITLSGLKVGVVGEMKFVKEHGEQGIRIQLKIKKSYADKITSSSRATLKTLGILGDKYVDITLGGTQDPVLQEGDYIQTQNLADANALIAKTGEIMAKLDKTLTNLNALSEAVLSGEGPIGKLLVDKEAGNEFARTVKNFRKITDQFANGQGSLGKLATDTTLYASMVATMQSFQQMMTDLQSGKGSLGKLMADTTIYTQFKAMTEQSNALLAKLQSNGTAGKVLNSPELYDEFNTLMKSLNQLMLDFRKNPGRYVSFKLF